ncbi:Pentatricopeptide repeat [Dillenia turbinata]|uniref:Pentatricopeptide repeat n=1 Tax=Dillenia turbinata TaxID=194707 RepID=A0AAN8U9G3_9MAGN
MTLPLHRSLHTQLLLYTEQRKLKAGALLHSLLIKTGWSSSTFLSNALINFYAKCEKFSQAHLKFEEIENKDVVSYNCIINGFSQMGPKGSSSTRVMDPFRKMQAETEIFPNPHTFAGVFAAASNSCIRPSEFTLVGVLNACSDICAIQEGKQVHAFVLKLGFELQIYVMSAVVDMYAKCGSIADARMGFNHLPEADLVLWTSMISGCVQNGENEEALALYGKMEMEGILPNELTLASVLRACSSLAALEQGKQVHAHAIKYGYGLEIPIGSALSTMYAKCGSLDDGNFVFRMMPSRDVVSWNAMISGLSQNGLANWTHPYLLQVMAFIHKASLLDADVVVELHWDALQNEMGLIATDICSIGDDVAIFACHHVGRIYATIVVTPTELETFFRRSISYFFIRRSMSYYVKLLLILCLPHSWIIFSFLDSKVRALQENICEAFPQFCMHCTELVKKLAMTKGLTQFEYSRFHQTVHSFVHFWYSLKSPVQTWPLCSECLCFFPD